MKAFNILVLLAGIALFAGVLYNADLSAVWEQLKHLGWVGMLVILIIYFITFLFDTATAYMTLLSAKLRPRWVYQLWQVMMYGDALNKVLPLASFGGEPIKAILLKRHLNVGYREGAASLVLFHTVASVALAPFVLIGFFFMFAIDNVDRSYWSVAGVGLALFAVAVAMLFLVQRLRAFSRASAWASKNRWGARVDAAIDVIRDIEERLIAFYTENSRGFLLALCFAFITWALGVAEIYYAMLFLGHPVTWGDAWVIEAVVVLVRTALFVVPANIGTQEGAFVVICGAVSGSPTTGLAVAAVIRARGLLWTFWGLMIGWRMEPGRQKLRPPTPEEDLRCGV